MRSTGCRQEELIISHKLKVTVLFVIAMVLLAGLPGCSTRAGDNPEHTMEALLTDLVQKDKSVKNCVLSVAKGDGSFSWSGAAGIAREDKQAPMGKETPIYAASITKLYTAVAVMRLYEEGFLSLDDPMARYLPKSLIEGIHWYKGKDYSDKITIRQLLSHTSGIPDYYNGKPDGGKSLFELFVERPERRWTVEETIDRVRKDLRPRSRPGRRAVYSGTNYQLLGKIIEAATGKPLHLVFEELIFRPLGLTHTYLIGWPQPQSAPPPVPADVFYGDRNITTTRSNGAHWADGGIVSTAPEIIAFLKALNEGRIIHRQTLGLMHDWRKLEFPLQYGYGTMRFNLPWLVSSAVSLPPLWGHSGSTGSFCYYSEDLDLYMAGTVDQVDSKSTPFMLMRKVIKAMRSRAVVSASSND